MPNTIDLGWYWSENKEEFQLAKIEEKDRATHFYVVGATGTGKTKFLEYLVKQDIEKRNGFGVIDPHGDLIEDIKDLLLSYYSPDDSEIKERIVLIDPTDQKYTVTFNPLEKLQNVSIPEQANGLVSSFKKIWSDSWGVRMEDLMRNSLISLGEAELTLTELPFFLTKRAFRKTVMEKVSHSIAKNYFQRFDTMTDRGQISWIEPVMNKINAFFSDDRIRQMFSSNRSSFNLREIMDQSKILLIKLDKGKLSDAADLLGSLLMAKIQMAAFSRSDIPKKKRVPFYLYIDEFQNFASESFAVVLSEARKYGLSLIMAHQTLAQIPTELRSLILGNAGIQVCFRLNRQDSNLLAKETFEYSGYEVKTFSSFSPKFWSLGEEWEHYISELQKLPPRYCYVKHKIEGGVVLLQTVDIEMTEEILDMDEEQYQKFIKGVPFGRKYLRERSALSAQVDQRHALLIPKEEESEKSIEERKVIPISPESTIKETEKPVREEPVISIKKIGHRPKLSAPEIKDESQHRYLQTLVKKMAEEKGYKAIIEQPTPNNLGRVDVGLEKDGKKVAIEISITSTADQELNNLEKCLKAGYEKVILCSPDKKTLENVKTLVSQKLKESEQKRILYFDPEGLILYFEEEFATETSKEERVKGYKVKVKYKTVHESERKTKREAVAQVILQALKRMKEKR